MTVLRRYVNIGSDSDRWQRFEHRPGDVIISTPPKSGTTLTQRLCALAIFETGDLSQPMDVLSPWFDQHTRSDEEIMAMVGAQEHRRFLKTHTPLDGIPYWDDVSYVATARDPLDIFDSWEAQLGNLLPEQQRAALESGVGLAAIADFLVPPPATLGERVDQWLNDDDINNFSLARHLHQMQLAWSRQSLSNVALLHFDDLRSDHEAALRAVAAAIDVSLSDTQVAELAPSASFDSMKADAANLAPNTKGIFAESDKFFRSGGSGGWRDLLTGDQVERYRARAAELAAPEFLDWLAERTQ